MIYILPFTDIVVNYIVIMIISIVMYSLSLGWISGNKEKTKYTKNIKIDKKTKLLLGFFFYNEDKIEMEAVINQIANYGITAILAVISLYYEIEPKVFGICYGIAFFTILLGCLIYRIKKDDLKE